MAKKIPRNRLYFKKNVFLKAFGLLFTPKALNGKYVDVFEKEFKAFLKVKHAIAVSSGKLALYLSLKYLGAKKGDKIILSDFNVPEVPALLVSCGFVPVLVDIDRSTLNIDPNLIEKNIDDKTKFILVTHIFGVPANIERISSIAKKYGLKIIEDACQAIGSEYNGNKVGTFGEIGYFSLGLLKPLSALNGGMIVTNDDKLACGIRDEIAHYNDMKRIRLLKDLIKTASIIFLTGEKVFNYFTYPVLSFLDRFNKQTKFNMLQGREIASISSSELERMKIKFSNLQALVGFENLKMLPCIINNVSQRTELLNKLLIESGIAFQHSDGNSESAYFKYCIRTQAREKAVNELFNSGIDITYGYMKSCSDVDNLSRYSTYCPESSLLTKENIYLPIHSLNSDDDVYYLAATVKKVLKNQRHNG